MNDHNIPTEADEAAVNRFISFMENELEWNGASISEAIYYGHGAYRKVSLLYTCYAGSSVITEIRKAANMIDVPCKVYWGVDANERGEGQLEEHDYYIHIRMSNIVCLTEEEFNLRVKRLVEIDGEKYKLVKV